MLVSNGEREWERAILHANDFVDYFCICILSMSLAEHYISKHKRLSIYLSGVKCKNREYLEWDVIKLQRRWVWVQAHSKIKLEDQLLFWRRYHMIHASIYFVFIPQNLVSLPWTYWYWKTFNWKRFSAFSFQWQWQSLIFCAYLTEYFTSSESVVTP